MHLKLKRVSHMKVCLTTVYKCLNLNLTNLNLKNLMCLTHARAGKLPYSAVAMRKPRSWSASNDVAAIFCNCKQKIDRKKRRRIFLHNRNRGFDLEWSFLVKEQRPCCRRRPPTPPRDLLGLSAPPPLPLPPFDSSASRRRRLDLLSFALLLHYLEK